MRLPRPATQPASWPQPAEPEPAARLIEAFARLGAETKRFAKTTQGVAVLNALGGNTPYLSDLAMAEPACLISVIADGADAGFAKIISGLRQIPLRASRAELTKTLRIAKRRAALTIAVADIGGLWNLAQVTGALSALAGAALEVSINSLLRDLHDRRLIKLPDPAQPAQNCGFVALALGKLGARELNYSSDIDLVLLYDLENPVYSSEAQPVMARLARDLVGLLSTRDEYGYVFRVDLRLRPNPAATPAVVSLQAALSYYESQGRTWERAAFSKARPIAGDLALGDKFLAAIKPFIWRRHLDFAAIADIHEMKRRIDTVQNPASPEDRRGIKAILGHDVKLGRGGIREIEFIVQTLGLVWGGQDPQLRIPQTLKALPALARAQHLPPAAARELATDYQVLRKVEHRLQMVADRQTHALPSTEAGLRAFTVFLDEPNFIEKFPRLLARVHEHFAAFFDAGGPSGGGIDPGREGKAPESFNAKLLALGFTDVQHVAERLRAWSNGDLPALRSERARELLEALLPTLLGALARQPEPDRAFIHFDTMISRQRAGIQLLSLFQRNPALLDRLTAVLGAAPAMAEHLAQDAQALEALLSPTAQFEAPTPILHRLLREARDLEEAVAITRRFVRREEFHLSIATLEGRLNADAAGRLRSNLADAALAALLPRVIAEHEARYGRLRGMKFGVIALGKAGSREMLAGSDLDLMLIYDHAPLKSAPTQYFVRLAHAFTGALTAQGPEGRLYQVDMRLRPSGNSGPVAVSLASFRRYHAGESWTWERLALTRARVLAATKDFQATLEREILTAIARPEPAGAVRAATVEMLTKVNAEISLAGPWDVKYRKGGLMEIAFIAQSLQLIHGPAEPALFRTNTAAALKALLHAKHLNDADATVLLAADFLWRTIQGIDRITGLREQDVSPPPIMLAPLLRATETTDLAHLRTVMAQAEDDVRDCFIRNINI